VLKNGLRYRRVGRTQGFPGKAAARDEHEQGRGRKSGNRHADGRRQASEVMAENDRGKGT
jgi:hypothetical protein